MFCVFFPPQGKVPVLSAEAVHQLHIFIFTLAIVHVTFSAMTIFIGGLKVSIRPSNVFFFLINLIIHVIVSLLLLLL